MHSSSSSGFYSIGLLAPVIAAAIAGSLLATQLGAVQTPIDIGPVSQLSGTEIVPFMILGVIGGGFAIALMRTVNVVELGLSRIHCPQAIRPILGGLIVGGLGLITPQVLSSGHGALELQFTHNYDMLALAGLFVLKGLASSVSLGSGFRGGLFFAALFLGALLGRLFSLLISATELGISVDPGLAALVGMAALAVGVVGGPLTLTFLVLETTGDLAITAAVLAAAAISGLLVRETFGFSFSTWRLHLRGENIRAPYDVGRVRNLTVGKLKGAQGSRPAMAVGSGVGAREASLPDVARHEVRVVGFPIPPRKHQIGQAAARGMLPFGLGGQTSAYLLGKSEGIVPTDVSHRVLFPPSEIAILSLRPVPGGSVNPAPPFRAHRALGSHCLRQLVEEDEGPTELFSLGDKAGCGDECGEPLVGDRGHVHAKRLDAHGAHGGFAIAFVNRPAGSHLHLAAGNIGCIRYGFGVARELAPSASVAVIATPEASSKI